MGSCLTLPLVIVHFFVYVACFGPQVELVPAFALYRGLYELGAYAFLGVYRNTRGMQFSNLTDDKNGMVGSAWLLFQPCIPTW